MSWQPIVALGLFYLAVGPAFTFGSIWNARAHPTPRVEVRFGRVERGQLTRSWEGAWVLVFDDKSELQFRDYEYMQFPAARHSQRSAIEHVAHDWRFLVPVFLPLLLGTAFLVRIVSGGAEFGGRGTRRPSSN